MAKAASPVFTRACSTPTARCSISPRRRSAAATCWATRSTPLTALWRDKQLQYTWLRAAQGRHADFWQVTGDALDFALEALGIDAPGLRDRLMNLLPHARRRSRRCRRCSSGSKAGGMRTAILSNGSPAMLQAAVVGAGLDGLLDAVLSVEEAGVYKPHPEGLSACRRPARRAGRQRSRSSRPTPGTPMRPRPSA